MALVQLPIDGGTKQIAEKSEAARREFFKKIEKIKKEHANSAKNMQDIADQAAAEYQKIFGRVGTHPLLHLKGGKQPIRYILDRDEVWVMYKPALWMMGGQIGGNFGWEAKVRNLAMSSPSLVEGQKVLLKTERMEAVQEWHGLTQGLAYIDPVQPVREWGFIQRLDVETDGPVVIAKTWRAQRALQVQMREHVFSKAYMCLVHGRVEHKVHNVKCKFAELGSEANSQVMLKNDRENDPFYDDWDMKAGKRNIRMAETFFKPLAYYHRKEDNTDYTLVYVNILSGITHQVRITMQSEGHPLVSDDRYLPKDQAQSDLRWCPRNFLTEVRSDWFDMCGPYKDGKRRKYARVSIENHLPRLFQNVLETRLTLVEKLDPNADLYVGTEYWAIGDEQLMNAYPKDDEYRRKVLRWGMRNGIHLDALDRLLLLEKDDVDIILNNYKGPQDREDETWICPLCMAYNQPNTHRSKEGACTGHVGQICEGKKVNDDKDMKLPKGWMNWLEDPTLHLLMIVNHRWLEARRKILRFARPSWEKPPTEPEGTPATKEILEVLEAALVLNLKAGGSGISEEDLIKIPGLEDLQLPLGAPPEEANVNRCRLPGKGTHSQWHYTLKGKLRLKYLENFEVKTKRCLAPVEVTTAKLPPQMLSSAEEQLRKRRQKEKEEKEKAEEEKKEQEAKKKRAAEAPADGESAAKKPRNWKKLESSSKPGSFYYFDEESGQSVSEKPSDFKEKPVWELKESKSAPGEVYYYNRETHESRVERPKGVPIIGEAKEEPIEWKRVESTSKPGNYYYFNPMTGSNEVFPPTVKPPWSCCESKSKKGQFYYYHEDTKETTVDPPSSARPAKSWPPNCSATLAEEKKKSGKPEPVISSSGNGEMPHGWRKEMSAKYAGKYYYVHDKSGKTTWEKPSMWEKKTSSSHPGKFYYVHQVTGETSWEKKA